MKTRSLPLPFARRLRNGQVVRFARPQRLCLRAERGTLWVTVDGQYEDIELRAGASRVFDGRAAVLVTALTGDALLSAKPLQPRIGWGDRLASLLGRAPAVLAS